MLFDNTTDRQTRDAFARAHAVRGKILGVLWGFLSVRR